MIARTKDLGKISEITSSCKIIYERIISQRTNRYFNDVYQLKNDFLNLSESIQKASRTLHIALIAWVTYLASEISKNIFSSGTSDTLHKIFFSESKDIGFFFLILAISLSFILFNYFIEVYSLNKDYKTIKELYSESLLFGEQAVKQFEKYIKQPKPSWIYCLSLMAVILIFVIKFIYSII